MIENRLELPTSRFDLRRHCLIPTKDDKVSTIAGHALAKVHPRHQDMVELLTSDCGAHLFFLLDACPRVGRQVEHCHLLLQVGCQLLKIKVEWSVVDRVFLVLNVLDSTKCIDCFQIWDELYLLVYH